MGAEARSVVVRLSMETAQAIRASKEFGSEMDRSMSQAERSSMRANQAVDRLGSTAGKVALVAGGALAASGKAAVDWESQFAGVEKTVDGTRQQLDGLEGDLRGMARTMPATHKEIAATAEAAGQLGVATEDVADFTKVMVEMGETTNLTADQAATDIAQFMNVMQTASGDVDEIANTIVDLGNKGASTEAQIVSMAQRVAGAGALIGASEADVLALSAAMANLGIESELGGGAVQRVLVGMNTQVASSGKYLESYAETAGMTAKEFAEAWETDPVRAFDAFIQGLGRIQASGGDVASALDSMGIKGTQNLQVMLRLAGSGDSLTKALGQSADAWAKNSALTDEYGKRLDTTGAQATVAMNNIRDAGIEVGDTLLPVIATVADGASKITGAFSAAPQPIQTMTTSALALTAVIGGTAWFGAKTVRGIAETRDALDSLSARGSRTATVIGRVGRVAGVAAIGITAFSTAVDLTNKQDPAAGIEENTRAILDMAAGAGDAKKQVDGLFTRDSSALGGPLKLTSEVDGLRDALEKLDTGSFEKLWSDPIFMDSDWDLARESIEGLDAAMAQAVSGGNADAAAAMFDYFSDTARDVGYSTDEVANLLPDYTDALVGVENSARSAAGANEEYAGGADEAGDAADKAAVDIDKLVASMEKQRDAALSAFGAETAWGAAIADARKQAATGEKGLNQYTEAGRNNRSALEGLAEAWNGQSAAVRNNEGRFQAARRTFIQVAESMGVPRKQAQGLADDLLAIPKSTVAKVNVDADQAMSAMDSVKAMLDRLDGTHAQTVVETVYQQTNKPKSLPGKPDGTGADGTTVPKTGLGYADRHHYLLADGEEVTTNRHGEADTFRPELKDINAGLTRSEVFSRMVARGLAGGGTTGSIARLAGGGSAGSSGSRSLDDRLAIAQALQQLHDLTRQLNERVKDGKHKGDLATRGLDRRVLQLQLEAARQDLKNAKSNGEYAAAASEAKQGLNLTSLLPSPELSPEQQTAKAGQDAAKETRNVLADFAKQIREAGGHLGKNFGDLTDRAATLSSRYAENADRMSRMNDAIDVLQAASDDLAAGVKSGLTSDIWAPPKSSSLPSYLAGSKVADPLAALSGDIADAERYQELSASLTDRGLSGDAFTEAASKGGLEGLELLSSYSDEQLASYSTLFKRRDDLTTAAGASVGDQQYGEQIAAQTQQVAAMAAQNAAMAAQIREMNGLLRAQAKAPERTGAAFGAAINGAAASAGRGKTKKPKVKGRR